MISQVYKEIHYDKTIHLDVTQGCSSDDCPRELIRQCVNTLITDICQIIFSGKIVITVISTVS